MRRIFPVCCASAEPQSAKSMALSVRTVICFFMFFSSPVHSTLVTRPSSHLISLFARASTSGAIVTPICFAVFRLMMSSNFVGCSTGRSAGLGSFQNSVHVICDAPVAVREVCAIGHEPTGLYSFSVVVHRRQPAL